MILDAVPRSTMIALMSVIVPGLLCVAAGRMALLPGPAPRCHWPCAPLPPHRLRHSPGWASRGHGGDVVPTGVSFATMVVIKAITVLAPVTPCRSDLLRVHSAERATALINGPLVSPRCTGAPNHRAETGDRLKARQQRGRHLMQHVMKAACLKRPATACRTDREDRRGRQECRWIGKSRSRRAFRECIEARKNPRSRIPRYRTG